jgi:hypothetical protein
MGIVAAALFLLSACSGPSAPDRQAKGEPQTNSSDTANALEALATESGVIGEDETSEPYGSYGRVYDGGQDRLCVLPEGAGASYKFGVEVRIGDEEYCRGKGSARRAGNLLIFRFAGGRCTITARYEGDRIVMPGAVDRGCASLCSTRGSFAGVIFPRIATDVGAARGVADNDGAPLCGG